MDTILPVLKMAGGIVVAILAFGLLIFIHELGHFIAAKRSGVKVNEFAIGMGPALFKFGKGETKYALRAIPFGGFVAMEGEDEESEDNRSFQTATLPRRAIIMVAGAFMNLLLGFLIIAIFTATQPYYGTNQVSVVTEDSVVQGVLEVGDTIVEMDGKTIKTYSDMAYQFTRTKTGIVNLKVNRDGEVVSLDNVEFSVAKLQKGDMGFYVVPVERTFPRVIKQSFDTSVMVTKQIWASLFDLVTGNVGFQEVSGPVGITKEIGTVSAQGDWSTVFMFIAMISINLGIVNLLPLPALDGGKLLLLLIEAIRKKPINPKYEMYINGIGLVLLLGFMVVVTVKDIFQLF